MMPSFQTIIYLHGFQSSSNSQKARSLVSYLESNHPELACFSPNLPFSPAATLGLIEKTLESCVSPVLMGSSMGGYYASYFSQKFSIPAVLVNPVVDAQPLFQSLTGQDIENVYTGEQYRFVETDLQDLSKIKECPISRPELILNLLETGDEVLDYRLAEKKYKICEQKIFQGGDHRFQNFENCIPEIIRFYTSTSQLG